MSLEHLKRDNVQGTTVGGFQINRASLSGVHGLKPRASADAPFVTGLEPGKTKLWGWRYQIVAHGPGKGEERFVDHAAHRV